MIRILLVDDHEIVREGLRLILETREDFKVIGEAENGQQALEIIETVTADIILLDINMPILDGLNFLKTFKSKRNDIPVIILTTYNEDHLLLEAIELGATSYILKDTGRERLFATIDAALKGETLLQPDMLQLLLKAQKERHTDALFSEKEMYVLKALGRGLKNSEIANEMNVSERTVKSYLTTIYSKLEVSNRTQATIVAKDKKYI